MTNKEALHDLFVEANRLQGEQYHFNTLELCDRYHLIRQDLEVLEQIKVKIDEEIKKQEQIRIKIDEELKKQEKIIVEYDNYAWKTQLLNTNFLIACNIKNTLEEIKKILEKDNQQGE